MKIRNDEAANEIMERIREIGMERAEEEIDFAEVVSGVRFNLSDYEDKDGEPEGSADARHEAKCQRIRDFVASCL